MGNREKETRKLLNTERSMALLPSPLGNGFLCHKNIMKYIKNLINNESFSSDDEWLDIINPSDGKIIGKVISSGKETVDMAVKSSAEAYSVWRNVPVVKRVKYLNRLLELMNENFEELSRLISLDEGKNLTDARAEMKRAVENLEVAISAPSILMGEFSSNVADGIDVYSISEPLGVFAIICPFNFPLMVPFWFFPYAVAAGNCVIIKPSEQVPLAMEMIGELVVRAGFPKGVINIVHGKQEAVSSLTVHPGISGISFVGSTATARIVAKMASSNLKRHQCFAGAKNYFVVMPDADMDKAISSLMTSCYGCAGERCMAASVVVGVGEVYESLKNEFIRASRAQITGNALDEKTDIGPVISAQAKNRILSLIEKGVEEGSNLMLDGRDIKIEGFEEGFYIGPTVFEHVRPGMTILETEIFGPVICLLKANDLEDAINQINNGRFGNGASIFTSSGYSARVFGEKTNAGMIGVNVGVPAPVPLFGFGGEKDSMIGDIKAQGRGVFDFFTTKKMITSRFFK